MDATSFNAALNRIATTQDWRKIECLPGMSSILVKLTERLSHIRSEAMNDTRGLIVCFQRTCVSETLDRGIADAIALRDPEVIDLHRFAPVFNESLLFGSGQVCGIFEASECPLLIRNIECLSNDGLRRLWCHAKVWVPASRRKILLAGCNVDFTELITSDLVGGVVESLQLPALCQRLSDLPYIIHVEAKRHGGGIDHFTLDAVNSFENHDWSFGVGEVEEVIRGLYLSTNQSESQIQFTKEHVDEIVDRVRRRAISGLGRGQSLPDPRNLWADLGSKIADVNRLTNSLIGRPFFSTDVVPATVSPLRSLNPELSFLQLVSWAYVTVIENGEPNLRCVLRFFSGQRIDNKRACQIRETIVSLRTYLQHSLAYSSDHDQSTLRQTYSWFERTIGRRQPESSDFEACIRRLILDCHELIDDVLHFLRKVGKDEFRDVVIQQWNDSREKTWPKHRFDGIVVAALGRLGRNDLNAGVVCNQNLKEMQDILLATVTDENRDASLRYFIEQRICEKYPLPLPVDGKDLIDLGVQPGPRIKEILDVVRKQFAAGQTNRNDLLNVAKHIIDNGPAQKLIE